MNKKIIVLVGASGCGKSAISNEIVKYDGFERVVTDTTRKPRPNEVDGVAYNFVNRKSFDPKDYLEYTEYSGNYYGTKAKRIDNILKRGNVAVLIMDINGAEAVRKEYGVNLVDVIYIERNHEDIVAAIKARNLPIEEENKRLAQLIADYQSKQRCDRVIKNITIEHSAEQIVTTFRLNNEVIGWVG